MEKYLMARYVALLLIVTGIPGQCFAQAQGKLIKQPRAQQDEALAIEEIIKYAARTHDSDAYPVAARMLRELSKPMASDALDGTTSPDKTFQQTDNKPQLRSSSNLLRAAKQSPNGAADVSAEGSEEQAKSESSAPAESVPPGAPACYYGYCHGTWGCWGACW
jgi:hypothetical protein